MRNRTRMGPIHRAFTLIEVLIVIAILLAIGGLVVVNLLPAKDKADINLLKSQFDQLGSALDLFKLNMGRYPSTEEGLAALMRKDALENEEDAVNWDGPYMKSDVTKDKWNNPLIYRYPGEIRGEEYYDIVSAGPDRQEGTADDITNHDRHKNADGEFAPTDDSSAPSEPTEG